MYNVISWIITPFFLALAYTCRFLAVNCKSIPGCFRVGYWGIMKLQKEAIWNDSKLDRKTHEKPNS